MQLTEEQQKQGWRIVKFGDIAKNVSKRVDPGDTGLEVYVGLEHLDPDNLRITRRGIPRDVKGQKLLVKSGQIIFGKRRAYQRKVAVADFEGICSAHAMVLEAIHKAVIPEYLPFFMQSDIFMERAKAISEGSLSPTIKWKTLANQKFPLPPRVQQEEILEVIQKLYNLANFTYDTYLKSLSFLQRLVDSTINNDRSSEPKPGWKRLMLKSLVDANCQSLKSPTDKNYKFNYIDISSVEYPGKLAATKIMKFIDAPSRAKRVVKLNDILVSTVRPNYKATLLINDTRKRNHIASTGFCVLTPKNGVNGEWLFFATLSKAFTHSLTNLMVGTGFPAVSDDDILVQKIDCPPDEDLIEYLVPLRQAHGTSSQLIDKYNKIKTLQKRILATFLGDSREGRA